MSDVVEKTSTRRPSRIPCVVVEKITTRRREGIGVVVDKMKKVDELSKKFVWIIYGNNAHRNSGCLIQNKQFKNKTKLWKQNDRCLNDVTTALVDPYRKLKKN